MYDNSIRKLSKRGRQLIAQIGGFEKAKEVFHREGSFLHYYQTGKKTNQELVSFFHKLERENYLPKKNASLLHDDVVNKPKLIDCYFKFKTETSVRVRNYLHWKETIEGFGKDLDVDFSFIKKYFLTNFDFGTEAKIGKKSVRDLVEIKLKLMQLIPRSDNNEIEPILANTKQKLVYESSLYPFLSREKINIINLSNNIFTNFNAIIIIYLGCISLFRMYSVNLSNQTYI